MRKLISQSTFHLKGTGWYVTDYASNRGGSTEKTEKPVKDTAVKEEKSSSDTPKKEPAKTGGKRKKD